MEYTGEYRTMYSEVCGELVDILKYTSKDKCPYDYCERCGKPLIRTMYVVQSADTALIHFYLGSECVKHLR